MRTGSPVQVYLTPEMKGQLERLSKHNMRTMSAEMVIALRKHLEQSETPLLEQPESAKPRGRTKRKE